MDSEQLSNGLKKADPFIVNYIYKGPIGDKIKRMVQKYGGSPLDAEDILTPTIMRTIALIRNGRYTEKGKCAHFILTVAKFIWKEEKKKKGNGIWNRNRKIEIEEEYLDILGNEEVDIFSIKNELERAESRQLLLSFIEQLDPKCHQLIRLRYLKGYSLKEIGTEMGLSNSYPNVLNSRCLDRLQRLLRDQRSRFKY